MTIELTRNRQLTANPVSPRTRAVSGPPSVQLDETHPDANGVALSDNRWYLFEVSGSPHAPGLRQRLGGVVYPLASTYGLVARYGSEELLELIVAAMEFPRSAASPRAARS
jgi:hypothetical protein